MAKAWSQSVASLESIYGILSDHGHLFVLVGKYTLKWMGVWHILDLYAWLSPHHGYPPPTVNIALQIMDILVRTLQVGFIC